MPKHPDEGLEPFEVLNLKFYYPQKHGIIQSVPLSFNY